MRFARRLTTTIRTHLAYQLVEIAGERIYLRHGVDVREGDVVLDVGGNVGVAAAFFAAECGAGLVHSFEPVPPLFALLRENLRPFDACVVHEYGLSSRTSTATITHYPWAAGMSGLYADAERDRAVVRESLMNLGVSKEEADRRLAHRFRGKRSFTCTLRALSEVLREESIEHADLLKVDVEGAELDVFLGVDDGDWPRIKQTVVEVHSEGTLAEIEPFLNRHGFDVVVDQDPVMKGTPIQMIYAVRR